MGLHQRGTARTRVLVTRAVLRLSDQRPVWICGRCRSLQGSEPLGRSLQVSEPLERSLQVSEPLARGEPQLPVFVGR